MWLMKLWLNGPTVIFARSVDLFWSGKEKKSSLHLSWFIFNFSFILSMNPKYSFLFTVFAFLFLSFFLSFFLSLGVKDDYYVFFLLSIYLSIYLSNISFFFIFALFQSIPDYNICFFSNQLLTFYVVNVKIIWNYIIACKLLMLYRNTWKHITVNKQIIIIR